MLITNTKSKLIAAQAGFLLAEIDTLSAQHLPADYAATGELITAHLTKLVHCSNDRNRVSFYIDLQFCRQISHRQYGY